MEYRIYGDTIQYLVTSLSKNEKVFADIGTVVMKDIGIKMNADYQQLLEHSLSLDTQSFIEFRNVLNSKKKMIFSIQSACEIMELESHESYYINPQRILCANHPLKQQSGTLALLDKMHLFLYGYGEIFSRRLDENTYFKFDANTVLAISEDTFIEKSDNDSVSLKGPGQVWLSTLGEPVRISQSIWVKEIE